MVHGPWVDLYSQHETFQNKGGKPFTILDIFMLRDHKMQRLYILYTKLGPLAPKLGLLTPKLTLRNLFPIGPQHQFGDSPRVTLLVQRSCREELPAPPILLQLQSYTTLSPT